MKPGMAPPATEVCQWQKFALSRTRRSGSDLYTFRQTPRALAYTPTRVNTKKAFACGRLFVTGR